MEVFLASESNDEEKDLVQAIRPELNNICSNPIRACILHLLIKAKSLNYSLNVEEIATAIGKRHSIVIHHLEKLKKCSLVDVVKSRKYGDKEKRSIWGLNLRFQNLISITYNHILKTFFTQNELEKMCSINNNVRNLRSETI